MSLEKSIPLTLSALGNGAVDAIPSSQENYYAQNGASVLISEFPSGDSAYYGALSTDPNNSSIGSYTDTFYNEPVGTHPGSSLSIGSTTTTLYQNKGDSVDAFAEWSRTVAADSSGDIYEMDSDSFYRWGYRLLETALTNEEPGCFRINSSIPGGEYEVYKSVLFQDTVASGSTDYNLYRKRSTTSVYFPPTYYTLQLKDSDAHHIQEMQGTTAVRSAYFAMRHAEQNSGLGDYLLLSDSDGSPTDLGYTGTWVARGVALDTRHQTQIQQYLGTFTSQFTGQYTGNFTGQYTGVSYANFADQYSGSRVNIYSGSRTYSANYAGSRNYASVVGQYAGSRNYGLAQYGGSRNYASVVGQYAGSRNYASVVGEYSGVRDIPQSFAGVRQFSANYGGSRNYSAAYTGSRNYSGEYAGTRPVPIQRPAQVLNPGNFNGQRNFVGTRTVALGAYSQFERQFVTSYVIFSGQRQTGYTGTRQIPGNFSGSRTVENVGYATYSSTNPPIPAGPAQEREPVPGNTNYRGSVKYSSDVVPGTYSGNRVSSPIQFTGLYRPISPEQPPALSFDGVRVNQPGQLFGGAREFQVVTGDIQFTGGPFPFGGNRLEDAQFEGVRLIPGSFAGSRNYASAPIQYGGSRNYASVVGEYSGVRAKSQDFAGTRPFSANYGGSRNYSAAYGGSRNYSGNYVGSRNYSADYSGSRNYASVVGQYAGSRNYASNPSQYAGNYAGQYGGFRAKVFTAQYSGTYSTQFTGQYTGSFSSNFDGETIISATETIHTYTLYCRVSET